MKTQSTFAKTNHRICTKMKNKNLWPSLNLRENFFTHDQ